MTQRSLGNLPAQLTSFVGREQELARLLQLLAQPHTRLLTLTGPGGVGKTRLATQVASSLPDNFQMTICFVSLAPITEEDLVFPTICQALGLTTTGNQILEDLLLSHLRDQHLLLVLDNFEQVISLAPKLTRFLEHCPHLTLLVTSRTVLHLRGEQEFPVSPLALPPLQQFSATSLSLAEKSSAVTLFCERVREVKPDFQVTLSNVSAIVELCNRLDGLPLALELAAARIKLFPPAALLERLKQDRHFLSTTTHDTPLRQQTLQNTIRWSYNLLNSHEQALFRQISIFVGGCSLSAVEELCHTLKQTDIPTLNVVTSLLDNSLLKQVNLDGSEPRIIMLETIREFGLDCLLEQDEAYAVQQAHASYFLQFAEKAEPELYQAEQLHWFDRFEQEHENLRTALRWLVEIHAAESALRLSLAVVRFWAIRGYVTEARQWFKVALALPELENCPPAIQAHALSWTGWLAVLQGELSTAERFLQQSLQRYKSLGDQAGCALSLHRLGLIKINQREFSSAAPLLEESITCYELVADTNGIAYSLLGLGCLPLGTKTAEELQRYQDRALTLFQTLNNQEGIAWIRINQANLSLILRNWEHAHYAAEECLKISRTLGLKEGIGKSLMLLGRIRLGQGAPADAKALFQESLEHFQVSSPHAVAIILYLLAGVALIQGDNVAALRYWQESLQKLRAFHDLTNMFGALASLAAIATEQQEHAWAACLWGTAEHVLNEPGLNLSAAETSEYQHRLTLTRAQLAPETFKRCRELGHTLRPEQVFEVRNQPLTDIPVEPLTQRELEVLRLLVHGLTNNLIADQLVISPRTVNAHLRSIYSKCMVTTRTAAAHYAVKHRLV